eukprot:6186059-Pleurochrysis_carterae.AAC.5
MGRDAQNACGGERCVQHPSHESGVRPAVAHSFAVTPRCASTPSKAFSGSEVGCDGDELDEVPTWRTNLEIMPTFASFHIFSTIVVARCSDSC